ncbi:hypothetical protein SEA_JACKO_17 [Microbacterium phage Jacko]|nr:hypothetical protein SEA_JACKO_17 [Microbacterium phage Jacko]
MALQDRAAEVNPVDRIHACTYTAITTTEQKDGDMEQHNDEREITEMILLVRTADQAVQRMGKEKRARQRSKTRRGRLRRALRRALKR